MFIAKLFEGMKLYASEEHRGFDRVSDHVSGFFSPNERANSVDTCAALCNFNPNHISMSGM